MLWYSRRIVPVATILALVLIAIGFGAAQFIQSERARELLRWQTQFAIIADGRKAVVDSWLGHQLEALQRLSDNASVQIYAMGLSGADPRDRDPAQQGYLRNLLDFAAQNDGFIDRQPAARIPANVRNLSLSGLLLLSRAGDVLSASDNAPSIERGLAAFVATLRPTDRARVETYLGAFDTPVIAFAVPVFAVQAGRSPDDLVGYIVGTKDLAAELFPLLSQPGDPSETAEIMLIARDGGSLRYLSPRRDGAEPMSRQLDITTRDLDSAYAWNEPGGFAEKIDYAGRSVLVTGRHLANAPWTLLYKVDRSEVLGGIEGQTRSFVISFILACLLATVAAILAWTLGASRKTRALAQAYRQSAEELAESRNFLALLRDEDPSPTFVVTQQGRITFANAALAQSAGVPIDDVVGKSLEQIFGTDYANRLLAGINDAFERHRTNRRTVTLTAGERERVVQANNVFISGGDARGASVMVIEDDITEIVTVRERRHRTQALVIDVLVSIIDQYDPTAKGHSGRVSHVAAWIGEAMDLSADEIETIRQAAILVNLGKAFIPNEILTKSASLTADELQTLHAALDRTQELLSAIDFDGPILEIVRQVWENWDGTGRPEGRAGEAIHRSARILRVANAFVAMLSARSYRRPSTLENAFATLMEESDHKYDRRLVIALVHLFENLDGRERWRRLTAPES